MWASNFYAVALMASADEFGRNVATERRIMNVGTPHAAYRTPTTAFSMRGFRSP
jgi:hypothetical protein